ncbi:hypothetical protein DL93DRAFT_2233112 [Clavulina sp. PMI_390]|nr:hypothetical protein DL93DRAFT_2233112 [Clavulina sp. PMI_390]
MSTALDGVVVAASALSISTNLLLSDCQFGVRASILDRLPIDVLVLVIENLDIRSVVLFSMVSRSTNALVNSRTVLIALALRCLSQEKIPASSFPLPQMELTELFKLLTRRERIIWAASHPSLEGPPRGQRTNINFVIPESAEAYHPLGKYEDQDDREYPNATSAVLPGGRWAVTLSGANHWHFSCYDLQTPVPDGFYEPVATMAIKPDKEDTSLSIQQFEYCDIDSTFTFLISSHQAYMVRDASIWPGWHCLVRLHISPMNLSPLFSLVPLPSIYHARDWYLTLAGDFVSFETLDDFLEFDNLAPSRALLWDWRKDIISNSVPSNIPPKNVMRRGRFFPTPDGSLIELEALASDSIVQIVFTIWSQASPSDNILGPSRSHIIEIELSPWPYSEVEVTSVYLEKWDCCVFSHDIYIILQIGRDWQEYPLYLVLNTESGVARPLYHQDTPNPELHDRSVQNSSDFFFAAYMPPTHGRVRRPTPEYPPRPDIAIEMGSGHPEVLELSLAFGQRYCVVVAPVMEGDKDFMFDFGPHPFCPRSGRWLLSREMYEEDDDEEEDEIETVLPVRKSFCPYMVVDHLE